MVAILYFANVLEKHNAGKGYRLFFTFYNFLIFL